MSISNLRMDLQWSSVYPIGSFWINETQLVNDNVTIPRGTLLQVKNVNVGGNRNVNVLFRPVGKTETTDYIYARKDGEILFPANLWYEREIERIGANIDELNRQIVLANQEWSITRNQYAAFKESIPSE